MEPNTHEPVIFTNGPIRILGRDLLADPPPALLVERGRVAAHGTVDDLTSLSGNTPRVVDLDGRTGLTPGSWTRWVITRRLAA